MQSHAERVLAENGEEFAEFIEGISPRARASLQGVIGQGLDFILGTGRRNVVTNAQYGYLLPNVIGFPYALFKQLITPLLTVGLKESGDILDRLIKRRVYGGGLTTRDGVYYTGKQLHDLADQAGLGYSTVSSERVGSLADDLLRDTRRAAEGPLEGVVKRELNPLDKSFYTRTAEAIEMSMRQAAFEAALIKGQSPRQAAETARRTFFDYSEVPGPIRDTIGQYVATAAGNTKLFTELMRAVMTNPSKARVLLKAQMQRARAQDPYNLHGDKALKTLGLFKVGDGVYFGPELPLLAAPELALGMARQADLLVQDLKRAQQASETAGAVVDQVVQGGEVLTRTLADEALPGVLRALDSFTEYAHHADAGRQTGAWDWFERVFKPKLVTPPEQLAHPDLPEYWTKAPKGVPHLLWGRDERGLPLYAVIEPSEDGETAMQLLRALTPNAIDEAFVAGTSAVELDPQEDGRPIQVYGGRALPRTGAEAAAGALLERAPVADPEEARRQQLLQIQQVAAGQ
jgi:hypothetical protein